MGKITCREILPQWSSTVKCSENRTTVTRAAVTKSNPREYAVKLSVQEHAGETNKRMLQDFETCTCSGNAQARRLPEKPGFTYLQSMDFQREPQSKHHLYCEQEKPAHCHGYLLLRLGTHQIINGTLARSLEPVVTECKEHTIHTQTQIVASRKPKEIKHTHEGEANFTT